MNLFELTVVLPGKLTQAKQKTIGEKIEKLVKTLKGSINNTEEWGEIELAYKLGKETTGNFVHFNLELESGSVKSLDQKLKIEDDIIRYLLVKTE